MFPERRAGASSAHRNRRDHPDPVDAPPARCRATSWRRVERTISGQVIVDEHRRAAGGFGLPALGVVAASTACGCSVATEIFDRVKLSTLCPTHQGCVELMAAAVQEAVEDGRMLTVDGRERLQRAEVAQVGTGVLLLAGP